MAHEKDEGFRGQHKGEGKGPHQGPPGPAVEETMGESQARPAPMGGVGSPTSGPKGEPMVKPPSQPPGQPKEGESSAAGEVGETDIPTDGSPEGQQGAGGGQKSPPHTGK